MGEYIVKIIKQWKEECGVHSPIQFKFSLLNDTLTIYTSQPGYLIGAEGHTYIKYKDMLKKEFYFDENFKIDFVETDFYYA